MFEQSLNMLSFHSMKKILMLAALCFMFSCENSQPAGTATEEESPAPDSIMDVKLPPPDTLQPDPPASNGFSFPYDIEHPDEKFKMPGRLDEISGLGMSDDGASLLAVNDEEGKLFYLNKNTGEVKREFKFGKSGDYEGVEMVDGHAYVVKSNGTLYNVKHPGKKKQKTKVYDTPLGHGNNVEGLAYDKTAHRLLIACKGKAGKGGYLKGKRAIYSFDLVEKKMAREPLFLIDREDIKQWRHREKTMAQRVIGFIEPSLADDAFGPSGIAVHPLTKNIYVLASVGKGLVVLSPTGEMLHFEPLNPELHRQPEGICFDADGTLFISNEANGGRAIVYRYIAKKNSSR